MAELACDGMGWNGHNPARCDPVNNIADRGELAISPVIGPRLALGIRPGRVLSTRNLLLAAFPLTRSSGQVTFALSPLSQKDLALPRKVLLADDSVTAQNMGRRILMDAGYEVITVNNGSSALKKVTESKPDLVVLDVYMPGYGGLEVCQRIRESQETARIPVLLTVGKLEPFKAEEARRVRADAFIVKPFEASELLTALTKLEDKIVPQPSGRKSGRSGRSLAEEEVTASKEYGDVESGWKNRLKIPPPHARVQPTSPRSDSALLSATPDREWPSSEVPPQVRPETQQEAKSEEPTAEVAVNSQLPETEQQNSELAIRADASADQTSIAVSEAPNTGNAPADEALPESIQTQSAAPEVAQVVRDDGIKEQRSSHEEEVAAALASLPSTVDASGAIPFEPAPVTMAAAMADQECSGPRWIAHEVTLTDDESSLILEQEMHKAFAAFAAADAARMSLSSPSTETHLGNSAPEQAQGAVSTASDSTQAGIGNGASYGSASETQEQTPASNATAAMAPEPAVQESDQRAAYAAAACAGSSAVSAEANAVAVAQSSVAAEVHTPGEPRQDSELASAWASWKQVRDSISAPELTSQTAAAPTFKEIRQEQPDAQPEPESSAAQAEENGAIASIVDSVLAELKPKLMEEIAKKMKKEK